MLLYMYIAPQQGQITCELYAGPASAVVSAFDCGAGGGAFDPQVRHIFLWKPFLLPLTQVGWLVERWTLSTGERLGSLSRNSVVGGTDRLQNYLNCVDGNVKPQQNKSL